MVYWDFLLYISGIRLLIIKNLIIKLIEKIKLILYKIGFG